MATLQNVDQVVLVGVVVMIGAAGIVGVPVAAQRVWFDVIVNAVYFFIRRAARIEVHDGLAGVHRDLFVGVGGDPDGVAIQVFHLQPQSVSAGDEGAEFGLLRRIGQW